MLYILTSCSDFFLSEVDECGVPNGDNSTCLDVCGIPNGLGISEGKCDCDNNTLDCANECGGSAILDVCGVCNGNEVDIDQCICDLDNPELIRDCSGECGGSKFITECGVCYSDNSICTGCMIPGADNYCSFCSISDNESCLVSYASVQIIFDNHCTACHGSSGGVDLSSYGALINSGNIIAAGDSSSSILWDVISSVNTASTMPPSGSLSNSSIHKIALWIQLGAEN